MCILTYLYILAEISAYHLQLKCTGGHFFPGHPYIESTTILSDKINVNKPFLHLSTVSSVMEHRHK